MNRESRYRRKIKINPSFTPCEAKEGDEIYPNGIFQFNISRILEDIESGRLKVIKEQINVREWFRTHDEGCINEDYMPFVELLKPVIQAEISNNRFNIIDGNHRMVKAHREGVAFIDSYKILGQQLPQYLITEYAYKAFINYWNSKLQE